MGRKRCYVVFRGRNPGIYLTWESCQEQVSGFRDNIYKGYNSVEEARADFVEWMNGPVIVRGTRPSTAETSYNQSTDVVNREDDFSPQLSVGTSSVRNERVIVDQQVVDAFAVGCMMGVLATIEQGSTKSDK